MVLQGSRSVSDYQCSFVPVFCIQLCCAGQSRSAFQVRKKINSLLMSPICSVVANGLRRSLNISNPLEMLY